MTAGLLTGSTGIFRFLGVSARMQTISLWTTFSFVFNGALFIVLGLQLPEIIRKVPPELTGQYPVIQPVLTVVALTLCLIALRFVWIWVGDITAAFAARFGKREAEPFGLRVRLAGAVAGVRGPSRWPAYCRCREPCRTVRRSPHGIWSSSLQPASSSAPW
ncbi:hypothetical protein ACVDG5_005855 [Mesorhizobium sp. ORM6]